MFFHFYFEGKDFSDSNVFSFFLWYQSDFNPKVSLQCKLSLACSRFYSKREFDSNELMFFDMLLWSYSETALKHVLILCLRAVPRTICLELLPKVRLCKVSLRKELAGWTAMISIILASPPCNISINNVQEQPRESWRKCVSLEFL